MDFNQMMNKVKSTCIQANELRKKHNQRKAEERIRMNESSSVTFLLDKQDELMRAIDFALSKRNIYKEYRKNADVVSFSRGRSENISYIEISFPCSFSDVSEEKRNQLLQKLNGLSFAAELEEFKSSRYIRNRVALKWVEFPNYDRSLNRVTVKLFVYGLER